MAKQIFLPETCSSNTCLLTSKQEFSRINRSFLSMYDYLFLIFNFLHNHVISIITHLIFCNNSPRDNCLSIFRTGMLLQQDFILESSKHHSLSLSLFVYFSASTTRITVVFPNPRISARKVVPSDSHRPLPASKRHSLSLSLDKNHSKIFPNIPAARARAFKQYFMTRADNDRAY